ncbi:MAG: DNRLRE domain-containing protein [Flavobacteriales bacterium]|nr:DNRLRE domain-containing protein [Flavobacteriales bacterium]
MLHADHGMGQDATLHGLISEVNTNWGHITQFPVMAWTFLGVPGVVRGALEFSLIPIPSGATITNARLSLHAYDSPVGFGQHSDLSGANGAWIRRITTPWNESTVTWNTHPGFTLQNQVAISGTSNPLQDYPVIDVTALVQDMTNDPQNSHGFLIQQQTEQYFRRLNFATREHPDPLRRPTLEVCFNLLTNGSIEQADPGFSLLPNPAGDRVHLDAGARIIDRVQVLDALGRSVLAEAISRPNTMVDVSGLPSGTYIVLVSGRGGECWVKRLAIVR